MNLTFCSTLTLSTILVDHAPCIISKHIGKLSLIDVSKILTLGKLVKVIFGAAFHKLKYEPSLKSVTIR